MKPERSSRLWARGAIAWSLFGCLIATFFYVDNFLLREVLSPSATYSFSETSNAVELGDVSKATRRISERLRLSFDFRINPDILERRLGDGYQNIFQTSAVNKGIRLELSAADGRNSRWGLVVGRPNGDLAGYDLGRLPEADRWHHFVLEKLNGEIQVWLDDVLLGTPIKADHEIPFDDIAVGTGFSKTRPFNGEVRSFRIVHSIELYSKAVRFWIYLAAGSVLALVGLIAAFRKRMTVSASRRMVEVSGSSSLLLALTSLVLLFGGVIGLSGLNESASKYFIYLAWCIVSLFIVSTIRLACVNRFITWLVGMVVIGGSFLVLVVYSVGGAYLAKMAKSVEGFSTEDVAAVFQTAGPEVVEFVGSYFNTGELLGIAIFPLMAVAGLLVAFVGRVYQGKSAVAGIALAAGIVTPAFLPVTDVTASHFRTAYHEFQRNAREQREVIQSRAAIRLDGISKKGGGELYVVVIGESANRDHLSAYGYFRKTSPWLDEKRGARNWLFFDNAYASFSHTVPSLIHALTQSNQYNSIEFKTAPSLIDVAKAAGFGTYWIDEQGTALGDTPLNAIGGVASRMVYVRPDGAILDALGKVLSSIDRSRNNLVILHLMGSHADYKRRVPTDYRAEFGDGIEELGNIAKDGEFVDSVLDPYDRSIHYTDHLMSELWNSIVQGYGEPTAFTYFSDHGEDVYGKKFHNASQFTYPMVRIPLVTAFSSKWIDEHPDKYRTLTRNRDKIFTLDLFYEAMLSIMGIDGLTVDPGFDIGDPAYRLDESSAVTMRVGQDLDRALYAASEPHFIKDDPQLIAKENVRFLNSEYPGKALSVHNDMASRMYESAYLGFAGVEINFGIPSLRMGHYPESVYPISLDTFLSNGPGSKFQRYWFDAKLEQGSLPQDALERLNAIDRQYSVKHRALLEVSEDGLTELLESGWNVAYYIRDGKDQWGRCIRSEIDAPQCAREIAEIIRRNHVTSVSFAAEHYSFIKKHLEPLLPKSVKYHTFGLPAEFDIYNSRFADVVRRSAVFRDKRVATILLESSRRFGETLGQ